MNAGSSLLTRATVQLWVSEGMAGVEMAAENELSGSECLADCGLGVSDCGLGVSDCLSINTSITAFTLKFERLSVLDVACLKARQFEMRSIVEIRCRHS
jgi:hypothetical protein